MADCDDARALADFLQWTQRNPNAQVLANRQGYVLANVDETLMSLFYTQLKNFTCDGTPVSALAGCINDGALCSNMGTCVDSRCSCFSERTGTYCEFESSEGISDTGVIIVCTSLSCSTSFSSE